MGPPLFCHTSAAILSSIFSWFRDLSIKPMLNSTFFMASGIHFWDLFIEHMWNSKFRASFKFYMFYTGFRQFMFIFFGRRKWYSPNFNFSYKFCTFWDHFELSSGYPNMWFSRASKKGSVFLYDFYSKVTFSHINFDMFCLVSTHQFYMNNVMKFYHVH